MLIFFTKFKLLIFKLFKCKLQKINSNKITCFSMVREEEKAKSFLSTPLVFAASQEPRGIYIQQIDPVNNTFHLFIAYFVGKKHFIFILLFNAKYLISVNFFCSIFLREYCFR